MQTTKAVFRFVLSKNGQVRSWILDLKNAPGSLQEQVDPKDRSTQADCTLSLSDADFAGLVSGEKTAMSLFLAGQLKIQGNMVVAQKLSSVLQASKAAVGSPAKSAPAQNPRLQSPQPQPVDAKFAPAQQIFERMQMRLSQHPNPPAHIFQFELEEQSSRGVWIVDGKARTVYHATQPRDGIKADCTLTLTQSDFLDLASGKSEPMGMFFAGKVRIGGNMSLAQKLRSVFQVPSKL